MLAGVHDCLSPLYTTASNEILTHVCNLVVFDLHPLMKYDISQHATTDCNPCLASLFSVSCSPKPVEKTTAMHPFSYCQTLAAVLAKVIRQGRAKLWLYVLHGLSNVSAEPLQMVAVKSKVC